MQTKLNRFLVLPTTVFILLLSLTSSGQAASIAENNISTEKTIDIEEKLDSKGRGMGRALREFLRFVGKEIIRQGVRAGVEVTVESAFNALSSSNSSETYLGSYFYDPENGYHLTGSPHNGWHIYNFTSDYWEPINPPPVPVYRVADVFVNSDGHLIYKWVSM